MKKFTALKIGFCCWLPIMGMAQAKNDTLIGTIDSSANAVVRAFERNRDLQHTAAAVSLVTMADLQRFNNNSLLLAINILPGVKMEERSPGSYRLNIRGSSLRSPFGIRNVKVYLNDMIFTDPAGGTYLNQLGFYNVASMEVLKGPPSSMYGAGTGGALLLQTEPTRWEPGATVDYVAGSYGLQQVRTKLQWGESKNQNTVSYQHQTADGYRDQSAMRRDVVTYETQLRASDKQKLSAFFMYGDLYYQTPGGLTLAQYNANPRAARPRAGTQPSAQEAQAAIYQKTLYGGIRNEYQLATHWKNTTSVYGAFTWFNNPGIRVYEKRTEPHVGARTVFENPYNWGANKLNIVYGAEAQKGIFTGRTYTNKSGRSDSLQTDDEIDNWRYSVFAQVDLDLASGWMFSAGASFNKSFVGITRLNRFPVAPQNRYFGGIVSPRVSISKNIGNQLIYALVSQGFSPPTTSELLPSNGSINTTLVAESGTNYEIGLRGTITNKLHYDANIYRFLLTDAISQRRDISGNDFFVNTGGTEQEGVELQLKYDFIKNSAAFVQALSLGGSYAYQDFKYKNYKVLEADFTGNRLPGVPKQTAALVFDLVTQPGIYLNATYSYTDDINMDDAGTQKTPSYNLLGLRAGYKKVWAKHYGLELFVGADNIGDVTYSLGNDINAAAGRYYNAAAGRNYFAGISLRWLK